MYNGLRKMSGADVHVQLARSKKLRLAYMTPASGKNPGPKSTSICLRNLRRLRNTFVLVEENFLETETHSNLHKPTKSTIFPDSRNTVFFSATNQFINMIR